MNLQDKSHDKSHDKSVIETKVAPPEVEATPPAAESKWDFDPKTIDIYDGEKPLVREGKRKNSSYFQKSLLRTNQLSLIILGMSQDSKVFSSKIKEPIILPAKMLMIS